MDADFIFGETNTAEAFTCNSCVPPLEISVAQAHILINGLSNMYFDRPLLDYEQHEIDTLMYILQQAIEVNS